MGSFVLFGVDLYKVNWPLILYVIFSIAITAVGFANLYLGGIGRAVIWAIGAVIVCVFFGMRWFGNTAGDVTTWPPTLNMCPDYLTFVPTITGSTSSTGGGCVDLLGVSTVSAGLIKVKQSDINTIQGNDTQRLFEYTAADFPTNPTAANVQVACDRCTTAGVTWEGIWDGRTCVGIARLNTIPPDSACTISSYAGNVQAILSVATNGQQFDS